MRVSSHPAPREWNDYDNEMIMIKKKVYIWIIYWILGFFDIDILPNLF